MKTNSLSAVLISMLLAGALAGCKGTFEDEDNSYNPDQEPIDEHKVDSTQANLDGVVAATIEESPEDFVFDMSTANKIIGKGGSAAAEGKGCEASGSEAKITKSGCYIVQGTIDDGRLTIDLDKNDKGVVKLILDGACISSSTGAALKIKTCPKVSILLNDGTTSKMVSTTMADTSAAIQSSQTIYLSAGEAQTGRLDVFSSANQAIKTNDGLLVKSGTYNLTAEKNDCITAKDYVKIEGGKFSISAYQHGIKASSTKTDKGFVYISGGTFGIESTQPASDDNGRDGIHAEGSINIMGGEFSIKSSDDGISSGAHIVIKDGKFSIQKSDKCITAIGNISIEGGEFTLSPTAIKSGTESGSGHGITVKKASSGKRIGNVAISGGSINITNCYEGIQGVNIDISGGTIIISSLDDALNASSGSSASGFGGRPGFPAQNPDGQSGVNGLSISGGFLMAAAQGDGLDSNGDLVISGGTVLVSQCGNGNEALDAGDGCEPEIKGGVVIAIGSKGMASAPKASQTAFFASASGKAGKYLAINDSNGKNIMAWKAPQDYQIITASSPELGSGTYSIIEDASVSGTEFIKGTDYYCPADKATGTGSQISLSTGKVTSSAGRM